MDTSVKRRRRWAIEIKRRIAEESFEGSASVAQLAQKYAVNAKRRGFTILRHKTPTPCLEIGVVSNAPRVQAYSCRPFSCKQMSIPTTLLGVLFCLNE